MRHCIKTVLALSLLVFTMQFSSESNAKVKPLTEAQCTALRHDLDVYIKLVNKLFGNGPVVKALIKIAQADTDKLCPQPPPPPPPPVDDGNHYSADTSYECGIVNDTGTAVTDLGLDASMNFTNVDVPYKYVCMTQAACFNSVAQKYSVFNTTPTTRCADPNDQTVVHFTDAEVQSKIDLMP